MTACEKENKSESVDIGWCMVLQCSSYNLTLENLGGLATGGWLPPPPRTKSATEVAIEQQKGRLQDASNTHTQQPEGPEDHKDRGSPEMRQNRSPET